MIGHARRTGAPSQRPARGLGPAGRRADGQQARGQRGRDGHGDAGPRWWRAHAAPSLSVSARRPGRTARRPGCAEPWRA
ncbi:hypothetical protein E1165_10840 [Micromonospora sp. KC723]|nr:hypothetical protein E1165_10840 [Micromonospora sp. KC723]